MTTWMAPVLTFAVAMWRSGLAAAAPAPPVDLTGPPRGTL